MDYNEIMKRIQYEVISFEQRFGVRPNLIKLSLELVDILKFNTVMCLSSNMKLTVCGIEVEVETNTKNCIKVGYMR